MTEVNTNGICDASGLGIGSLAENGFKFIDLNDKMIKNDRDLEFFIDTLKMTHTCNDQDILENLCFPQYNVHLDELRVKSEDEVVPVFKFDAVFDIYKFLHGKWNFR